MSLPTLTALPYLIESVLDDTTFTDCAVGWEGGGSHDGNNPNGSGAGGSDIHGGDAGGGSGGDAAGSEDVGEIETGTVGEGGGVNDVDRMATQVG
ncbi:MAG: hypothetical protein KGL39_29350 [Patescibacteria group bacterium]|nr:hypothetical protein [Patescibacteria group bacterium]